LGDRAVGKTSFINRLAHRKFVTPIKVTIGADFHTLDFVFTDDDIIQEYQNMKDSSNIQTESKATKKKSRVSASDSSGGDGVDQKSISKQTKPTKTSKRASKGPMLHPTTRLTQMSLESLGLSHIRSSLPPSAASSSSSSRSGNDPLPAGSTRITVQLWDTQGQERFQTLGLSYFR
jgi:GTPase SAR1 family protein